MNCKRMISWKPLSGAGALFLLLLGGTTVSGQLTQEIVEKTTSATALVVVNTEYGPGFGTAFCISNEGFFATDAHVVLPIEGRLQLVIHPGEKDQQVVNAHVVGADSARDLAVIQPDTPVDVPALRLGDSDKLFPTQEVTAFGYPFGTELTVEKTSYPAISVNTGKVTSLRKKDGELYLVQIDAAVNPGNSGGPIIDDDGDVVGLAEAIVPGSGVNFAIPVARLQEMVDKPLINVEPGAVRWAQRGVKIPFTVRVTAPKNPTQDYQVNLSVKQST
ncbi:MAG: serine protease, partial [Opitutales bacterium]